VRGTRLYNINGRPSTNVTALSFGVLVVTWVFAVSLVQPERQHDVSAELMNLQMQH
jgi:hypothetical protein